MECIMHLFAVILLSAVLLNPSVLGFSFRNFPGEPQNKNFDFDYNSEKSENDTLNILSDSSEISINASEYPPDEERQESTSDILTSEITRIEKSNSTLASSSPVASTKNTPDTQSTGMENILTEVPSNGTNSTSSVPNSASSPPSTAGQTLSSNKPTSLGTTTSKGIIVSSTEDDEEQEGVVREKPSTTESTNTTTSKTGKLMFHYYYYSTLLQISKACDQKLCGF